MADITIVKIGSNTVVDKNGKVRHSVISALLRTIHAISDQHILLVTSGAVKLGRLALKNPAAETALAASIGQPQLFRHYQDAAEEASCSVAELLLTRPYLIRRDQFKNLTQTITGLLSHGVIPIINENDAVVAGTDWSFGDNDSLAAALAIAMNAKKLIILTHLDGLYDQDPTEYPKARLIPEVRDVNATLLKLISHKASAGGRGGMLSKIKAARLCTAIGISVHVVSGLKHENLLAVLKNERIGTTFLPRAVARELKAKERWILAAKNSSGSIEIDEGAAKAIRSGKSLLAVGAKKIYGEFEAGEIIEIVDKERQGIAFGIIDQASVTISPVIGKTQAKGVQLIHADNLVALFKTVVND